jgi:hypothetical protein
MLGIPAGAEIDVLTEENAETYWDRSDMFDFALDLSVGRRGLAALAAVVERWVKHMLSVEVRVEPLRELRDVRLVWYVGLDAEASRIGDALWQGEALDEKAWSRIAGLFRLTFGKADLPVALGESDAVYLLMAMTGDKLLRLKPQNLLTGLPVRHLAALA